MHQTFVLSVCHTMQPLPICALIYSYNMLLLVKWVCDHAWIEVRVEPQDLYTIICPVKLAV